MGQGLHDLFQLTEAGGRRLAAGGKLALAIGITVSALVFASDLIDRVSSSTPGFALAQAWREAVGERSFQERETLALLEFAKQETGLARLGALRVGVANELRGAGAQADFNWASFRVSLGEELDARGAWEQRWVSLHEIGHAAALSTLRFHPYPLPSWGLSPRAAEMMSSSLIYQQAYGESFADVFALALALRLDESDPEARKRLASALSHRLSSLSLAHDTDAALRLAAGRLAELSSARGRELMGLIDVIASEGAMRSVSDWGAEREALCSAGVWKWASWARTEGQMVVTPPWEMASADHPAPGEPLERELRELMAFRGAGGPVTRWSVERERGNYEAEARRQARGEITGQPAPSWGAQAAREESARRHAAREAAFGPAGALARAMRAERPLGCRF